MRAFPEGNGRFVAVVLTLALVAWVVLVVRYG
jgi:hypothetical protein